MNSQVSFTESASCTYTTLVLAHLVGLMSEYMGCCFFVCFFEFVELTGLFRRTE